MMRWVNGSVFIQTLDSTMFSAQWEFSSELPPIEEGGAVIFTGLIFLQFDCGGTSPWLRKSIQRRSFVSNMYSCLLLLYLIYCLFLLPLVSPTRCCTNSSKTALSKIIETMLHRRPIMRDLKSYLHLQSICIVCNAWNVDGSITGQGVFILYNTIF